MITLLLEKIYSEYWIGLWGVENVLILYKLVHQGNFKMICDYEVSY